MAESNEDIPAEGDPAAGEEGNANGDEKFELNDDGTPVLGEDGKPKPKAGKTEGENRRPAETPEAKRARLTRELDQLNKKHPVSKEPKEGEEGKKSELDYGQMAYLNSEGIKADDEQALAKQIMDETKKSLKDVVKSKYFLAELKELRDENAAADAIPNSKRNGQARSDSVEHWLAKGGLPPDTADNRQLRRDIVNARSKAGKEGKRFTDTPVA